MSIPEGEAFGFATNVVMVWVEALRAVFDDNPRLPLTVTTEFPMKETEYPALWVNLALQGDVRNVGIGHVEHVEGSAPGLVQEAFRWQFGGMIEITLGAMGNLERYRMLDEVMRTLAVARMDQNAEGVLRSHVERNGLVGQNVVWESVTVGGFAESPGTPWGTDDVVYECTLTIEIEGEFLVLPGTGDLVPLTSVVLTPMLPEEPAGSPPGSDGWV